MQKIIYHPLTNDEDAPPLAKPGMLAVADGLGGRGAATLTLADGSKKTDAYHASRLCLEVIDQLITPAYRQALFDDLRAAADREAIEKRLQNLARETGQAVKERMERFMAEHDLAVKTGGGLYSLPTTLALLLYQEHEDSVEVVSVWSGDSRCYVLDREGLAQLSTDNLNGDPDYYSLLQNDTDMTTQINLSKPFQVSARHCALKKPCILFTASDGMFMYLSRKLPNALALEFTLLRHLHAPTFQQGAEQLDTHLARFPHDDLTLAMAALCREDSADLRQMLVARATEFVKRYAEGWPKPEQEDAASQREEELRDELNGRQTAYEKEVRAALPGLVQDDAEILAQYPASLAFEEWKKQGDEDAKQADDGLRRQLEETTAAFGDALPGSWAELMEQLPQAQAQALQIDPKSKEGQLLAKLQKNAQKKQQLSRWIQEARERNAEPYQRFMDAMGSLGAVFSDDWQEKLPQIKDGIKHIDQHDIPFYITLNKMYHKAAKHQEVAQDILKQTERLKPHLAALAPEMAKALAALPDRGKAICGQIPGLAAPHQAMLDTQEALQEAESQEKARQEGLIKTRAERLMQDPGALADWLARQGFDSGEAWQAFRDTALSLKEHREKFSVYHDQWQQYKPAYQRFMDGPTGVSGEI